MPKRYTDLDVGTSGAKDFIIRRREPTTAQLTIIILSAFIAALSVATAVPEKIAVTCILTAIFGIISWYALIQIQRNRDLVLTTEFQNALFASALGLNNKFCIIIKSNGNIVYLDRSFQEMFPDFINMSHRTIDLLLEYGKVSREDSEKIYTAIEQSVYDKIIFEIRGADNRFHKIVMSVEPILRPSGFILLRGREFIEHRNNAMVNIDTDTKPNISLFSHVVDTLNVGVYMTDPVGNIIYANPILEQWLGFLEGEINSQPISLKNIVQDHVSTYTIEPKDFEGEATLQRKNGGNIKVFINQKIIREDQKKLIGCVALVHQITNQNEDIRKKLW